ncbi:DUF4091 domain-containing protein [Niameybacter massiliensis]|uniref:DUF4091 domain-containing protein n=1 Tax=Holtiella tumoricola TaxID=3018743 RepID=A0AA42DN84_9FIRM|nr:glycoside hydrolase domain-containing protein [Holtiella tumoricola]MDA3731758.1 DUF4091 domain-containing protein [Holtiella tumoricola]
MRESLLNGTIVESGLHYSRESYEALREIHKDKDYLWAWKNDKALSEIVLLSGDKPLNDIHICTSDFVKGTECIPSTCIKTFFVKEVKGFIGHAGWYAYNKAGIMPTGPREMFPDVLWEDTVCSMPALSIQSIWIEIQVPEDVSAGIYEGRVEVHCEENKLSFDYQLEVLEAVLPTPEHYLFDVEYWQHPYNLAEYYQLEPFSKAHLEKLKEHMQCYQALGGQTITASIVEEAWGGQTYSQNPIHYPSMIKWIRKKDGTFSFDYTHFDKWVALNLELGLLQQVVCYSMMPWESKILYKDEISGEQKVLIADVGDPKNYQAVWRPFLKDFVKHIEAKGWFEYVCIGFDERHQMEVALDLVDEVKNSKGKSMKKVAAFNDFVGNKKVLDQLSHVSVGLEEIRQNVEAFKVEVMNRKKLGRKTTLYTATEHFPNSFVKSIPVESYWTIMYAGSLGTDGFLRWAFDAWGENPLQDTTHASFQAGDCFLIYPDCRWSVRLAKLDEGVRDMNKLYVMAKKCPELEGPIKALLNQVKCQYDYDEVETPPTWAVAGRSAKWAREESKIEMLKDMQKIKEGIYAISKQYSNQEVLSLKIKKNSI